MIKSVDIHNFNAHKDTHVDWDTGFCVLSGESAAGKSSIRRAILWVITNRPSGTAFINWDCFDKKKVLIDKCRVTLVMDSGTVITREKSPVFNGYFIQTPEMTEPKRLEAVGTDVPEEVTKLLNFSDVNYQKQFDSPFLIGDTSGDVAKYINKLVNLEDADMYQTTVESLRKDTEKTIKINTSDISAETIAIEKLSWLDSAKQIIQTYDEHQKKSTEITVQINRAEELLEELYRYELRKTGTSVYIKAENLLSQVSADTHKKDNLTKAEQLMVQLNTAQQEIVKSGCWQKAEQLLQKINTIQMSADNKKENIKKAEILMETAVQNHRSMIQYGKEIEEANKELASVDVCPLCGSKLGEKINV